MFKKVAGIGIFFSALSLYGQNYSWTVLNETGKVVKVLLITNSNSIEKILSATDNVWTLPYTNWCFKSVKVIGISSDISKVAPLEVRVPGNPPCGSRLVTLKLVQEGGVQVFKIEIVSQSQSFQAGTLGLQSAAAMSPSIAQLKEEKIAQLAAQ